MIKKILLFSISLLWAASMSAQQVSIPLQVGYFDPSGPMGEQPRSPIKAPTVYLEDYSLTFTANHPEYVLYIKDEYETVVYSTVVTSAMTEVTLPSTLSGDYEIDLVMGNWLFTGYIEL